jgi:hypothetical protein
VVEKSISTDFICRIPRGGWLHWVTERLMDDVGIGEVLRQELAGQRQRRRETWGAVRAVRSRGATQRDREQRWESELFFHFSP